MTTKLSLQERLIGWVKRSWDSNLSKRTWRLRLLRVRARWQDYRLSWIILTIGFACLLSYGFYYIVPDALNIQTFSGALFTSWLSGLAIAVIVTVSFTLATIYRPDHDPFETRARNLLRGQTGPHISFIIPRIQELLRPYCDKVVRELTITEYHKGDRAFRVNQYTDNYIQSYLNDIPVEFPTKLIYQRGTPSPKDRESASLTFLRVDGVVLCENHTFQEGIEFPFTHKVHPNEVCRIEHRMVYWVKAKSEANRHAPTRFTNNMKVIVHNELQSDTLVASLFSVKNSEMSVDDNPAEAVLLEDIEIGPGATKTIIEAFDKPPYIFAYDFRLALKQHD